MAYLRLIIRSLLVITIILIGALLTPLILRNTMDRHGFVAKTTSFWHRCLAMALGIRITRHGACAEGATLYVSNHISWFDISAIGCLVPTRFLSKSEVKDWPLIGWLATKAGTLYIKRGAHGSKAAIATMSSALASDQNVCLFPEGTTTDGDVRRFHGRLIQSAIDAGVSVQPIVLFYRPPRDTLGLKAHPDILYIDDTSLADSLLMMLRSPDIVADIHLLEPIDTDEMTRDELAKLCESRIADKLEELSTTA